MGGIENIVQMVESADFQKMLDTEGIENNLAEIQGKNYFQRLIPSYDTRESIERILNLNQIDFKTVKHEANLATNRLIDFLHFSEDVKNVVLSKTKLLTNG